MSATGRESIGPAAGFTLIELLVVMTIMTLALALVPPLLSSGRASQSLKIDLRQIVSGLQLARAQAILLNRPVSLTIDPRRRQLTLENEGEIGRLHDTTDLALSGGDGGAGSFLFYPGGGSSGGDIAVASDRQRYRVLIDWLTGDVSTVRE